jgi:hypothetical protein
MAAPAMAVSQVDRLKPCMLWMRNCSVASQPPSSAPTIPMMQVCDYEALLPAARDQQLAVRPAARAKTIQAIILITDSLSQQIRSRFAVVGHAGRSCPARTSPVISRGGRP